MMSSEGEQSGDGSHDASVEGWVVGQSLSPPPRSLEEVMVVIEVAVSVAVTEEASVVAIVAASVAEVVSVVEAEVSAVAEMISAAGAEVVLAEVSGTYIRC